MDDMQPVTPAPEIPNDVARALRLSDSPDLRHIGYWRDTEDGSDGYAHQAMAQLLKNVEPSGPSEPYLRRSVMLSNRLPWPGDHLDPSMDDGERDRLTEQLFDLNKHTTMRYASPSWDRLSWTGAPPWKCLSWPNTMGMDEVVHQGWVWPEGLFRYVQRHRLVLPQAFLRDVGISGS